MSIEEAVKAGMKSVKTPKEFDKVYKDECMLCFTNPFDKDGVFVSLRTWYGYCARHAQACCEKSGDSLFLQVKYTKKDIPASEQPEVTKMAIGVEGGFSGTAQYEVLKAYALAAFKPGAGYETTLVDQQALPMVCYEACEGVKKSAGASFKEEVSAWEDVDAETDSKYAATLPQVENPPKISPNPADWKCELTGARESLWLNLSTGYIGGGRKYHDGTGGSGGALVHFEETGKKYPLVVKLGTITPNGADVYSYADDENRSCKDPKLAEHLSHFGIDIMKQEKTVKTTVELSVELNKFHDSSRILEAHKELAPVFGPGFQGLVNIGNSCYIASVMQMLATLPEVRSAYFEHGDAVVSSCPQDQNPADDTLTQLAKLVTVLCSGDFSRAGEADNPAHHVRPQMFRAAVGRGHAEFSSSRQQDAREYLEHLVEKVTRAEKAGAARLAGSAAGLDTLFTFETVQRLECDATKKVAYKTVTERDLGLKVPMEAAINIEAVSAYAERKAKRAKKDHSDEKEPETPVIPIVPFDSMLERFAAKGTITDWISPATGTKGTATTETRFKTFPKYLAVIVQRYYWNEKWEPTKLEVAVKMPECLDLEGLRGGTDLKPGEQPLPESAAASKPAEVTPDEEILAQLASMGFDLNGCKKACVAVKNASVDSAMEWVLAHMGDADFAEPPAAPSGGEAGPAYSADDVAMLTGLGFTEKQVEKALKNTGGSAERAADWLFSHPDEAGGDEQAAPVVAEPARAADGPGMYALQGFVSHIGKNTGSGHYVAHLKKDGEWYIYNDEKVAKSQDPPFDLAYIYLYKRNDV
ncbi:Ubiquitin carboxyl-terminal hydrolase 14 [Diplonema papillatum]|nr:Ubiquitin carboxyl-terminal hydrolase 14 [Diplonema papillatum]